MAAAVWPASACEATKFGGNGLTVQMPVMSADSSATWRASWPCGDLRERSGSRGSLLITPACHLGRRPSTSALPPLSFDDAREERARGGFDLRADQPAPCRHYAEWLLSGVLCHHR